MFKKMDGTVRLIIAVFSPSGKFNPFTSMTHSSRKFRRCRDVTRILICGAVSKIFDKRLVPV
jgi:hypothetical protein